MKHERSIALDEEKSARLNHSPECFAHQRCMLAKVLRDDRRLARRPGMVAGVREARQALEQDLELEQVLHLALQREPGEPLLARDGVLAPQTARVAEQIVVYVALLGGGAARRACRGQRSRS